MKDFVTGLDIDVQGLMEVVKSTERRPAARFSMSSWCGTRCCMVGSFCADHPEDELFIDGDEPVLRSAAFDRPHFPEQPFVDVAMRFGMSYGAARYLFDCPWEHVGDDTVTAANRLRKYLYYKMRKSEMLADYDAARRLSDVGFVDNDISELEVSHV